MRKPLNALYASMSRRATFHRTIRDYMKYWRQFFEVIKKTDVFDVTKEDFRRYITTLLNQHELSPTTVNIRLVSVKAIFSKMVAELGRTCSRRQKSLEVVGVWVIKSYTSTTSMH
ncbi:phage integrase N-terminal SAM-like domain-containing protein [Halobacillus dabanensis]